MKRGKNHCGAHVEFGLCGGLVLVRIRVEKITGFLFLTGIIIPNLAKLNMAWPKLRQKYPVIFLHFPDVREHPCPDAKNVF